MWSTTGLMFGAVFSFFLNDFLVLKNKMNERKGFLTSQLDLVNHRKGHICKGLFFFGVLSLVFLIEV